ncbi:hypothetical protein Psi02_33160 [Planotetraspora silvatica]|uniref:Uncharacterized protein n=1 Tax=Planotetraspora silvatica TaxID=234614 RepID=A0A8J3UKY7_9ACTN|nr:hypothetical protein [Planotetraspora silvatica]GII46892.1 hypothetical protein Psi02_33160 [Planotetraspora silvatica]
MSPRPRPYVVVAGFGSMNAEPSFDDEETLVEVLTDAWTSILYGRRDPAQLSEARPTVGSDTGSATRDRRSS